jgi:prepilin-type N-terminal cleavage/methylation domain-containing protein
MTRSRARSGLTLLEVVIAVAVLAVGVLAALGLQGTALNATGRARASQEVSKLAQAELAIRREMTLAPVTNQACRTIVPTGYGCTVTVSACSLASSTFSCTGTIATPVAHFVTVNVTGPRSPVLTVNALVATP